MKSADTVMSRGDETLREVETARELRRRALVREMVAGAILPGLLARKDAGVFDRASNIVRLQAGRTQD